MAIYLKVTEDNKNQNVRVGSRPIFIGRSSKCHITLNDNMVSGKHLAIKVNADQHVVIKDLNTTNGTYLNGNKIDESLLYLDDFIQIGRVKISLISKEMTSQELKVHQRDFERTNVTFVKLGNQISPTDDDEDHGISKQRTLLAKIREKNKQVDPNLSSTRPQKADQNEELPNITFNKDGTSSKIQDDQDKEVVCDLPDMHENDVDLEDIPSSEKVATSSSHQEKNDDDDEYEYEYIDEDEDPAGLVSKLKGLFKR